MGFRSAIVPKGNLPLSSLVDNIEIKGVEFLIEALEAVMPGQAMSSGRVDAGRMPAFPGALPGLED
jgi:hypothetical protein